MREPVIVNQMEVSHFKPLFPPHYVLIRSVNVNQQQAIGNRAQWHKVV